MSTSTKRLQALVQRDVIEKYGHPVPSQKVAKKKTNSRTLPKKSPAVFAWEESSLRDSSSLHGYFSVAAFVPAVRPKTITSAMALPPKRLEP